MKKNIQGNIEQGELGEILEKEGKFGKKKWEWIEKKRERGQIFEIEKRMKYEKK